MSGTFSVDATGETGSFSLAYNRDLYERESSFDLLRGQWDGGSDSLSITVDGRFIGELRGCPVDGSFSLIDSRYNAYEGRISFSACGLPDVDVLAFMSGSTDFNLFIYNDDLLDVEVLSR